MLPYTACHVTSFIISLIVGAGTFLLWASILMKYRKNKTQIRFYILFVVLFLAIAIIIDPLVFLYTRLYVPTLAEADLVIIDQTAVSFALVGIANIFLAFFIHDVFFEKTSQWPTYFFMIVESLVVVGLLATPFNVLDLLTVLVGQVLISLLLYIIQLFLAIRLSRRLTNENQSKVTIRAIQSIGLSGVLLLATMLSFIFQEFSVDLGFADALGCSFFIPLGWICAGLATFSYYLGYFMPEWLKKRYSK